MRFQFCSILWMLGSVAEQVQVLMKNLVFSVLGFKCKKAAMCGSMRLPGRSCCDFWMKVNYCSRKAIILLSSCFQSLSWVQCSLRWSIMHRNQSCHLANAVFLLCRSQQHCCDRRSSKFPVNFIHPCRWMEQEWKCLLWSCLFIAGENSVSFWRWNSYFICLSSIILATKRCLYL